MSPVSGFEAESESFLAAMRALGLRVTLQGQALRSLGLAPEGTT